MTRTVDYFLSLNSPWTYFGHERFREILRRHGATTRVKPVDYDRVFAASGGLPLRRRAPQRQAYRLYELERWRTHLNVPLNINPRHFPVSGNLAAMMVIAADMLDDRDRTLDLVGAILRGVWAEERDIADTDQLKAIAVSIGFDAERLAARAAAPETKAAYDALTDEAIERQVFGAPFYVYAGEPFWGQDRLEFLNRALARPTAG